LYKNLNDGMSQCDSPGLHPRPLFKGRRDKWCKNVIMTKPPTGEDIRDNLTPDYSGLD
jgi:hypothetical protein